MPATQTHTLTADCPCQPDRERWDEQAQQWVTVTLPR